LCFGQVLAAGSHWATFRIQSSIPFFRGRRSACPLARTRDTLAIAWLRGDPRLAL